MHIIYFLLFFFFLLLRELNFCRFYSLRDVILFNHRRQPYTRPSHDRKIDSQRRLRITNSGGGCARERVRRAPRKEIFQCLDIECTYLEDRSR